VVKEASADVIFATLGERDEEANAVLDLRLKVRKERSAPEGTQYPFEAKIVDMGRDADGLPLTSRVINWNVERLKRVKQEKKSPAQIIMSEALAKSLQTKPEWITVNGTKVEAVQEKHLQATFRDLYLRSNPGVSSDAVGEARRRAFDKLGNTVVRTIVEGVVYVWVAAEIL